MSLANKLNWDLALRRTYYAPIVIGEVDKRNPIPPIVLTLDSYILQVGIKSSIAKPHWFLGGRISQRLLISPSSTSDYISAVQSSLSIPLGLDRLTLVEFKDFGVSPYLAVIEIPKWHKEVSLEVWKYSE